MSYTQVFGGGTIYPSDVSYSHTSLNGSITLRWPTETGSGPLACSIMDIDASVVGAAITLPDATLVSKGENTLFNNIGSQAVSVLSNTGVQIAVIPPSTVWQVYLTDNTTVGGVWRCYQFGAGTSLAISGALAGAGLTASGATLSQAVPVTTFSVDYTTGAGDQAKALVWIGGNGTVTLTLATTVGAGWFTHLKNSGTGSLVITASGGDLIDGLGSRTLNPGDGVMLFCDGTTFYSIGGGAGGGSSTAFTFLSVPVPGSGVYTLSPVQYGNSALRFTGALTGSRDVIIPNTTGSYYLDNATSGPGTLTVRTSAGTGYAIPQGTRMIVYCDGTNAYDAVSLGTSGGIIPIINGGTGATTAATALVNLGGTSLGTGLFTAPSATAARSSLGASAVGDALFSALSAAAARTAIGMTPVGDAVASASTQVAARTAIGALAEDDALVYALTFG